jgi:hypothetical protein
MDTSTIKQILRRLQLANHAIKDAQRLMVESGDNSLASDTTSLELTIDFLKMSFDNVKYSASALQMLDYLEGDLINDRARQMQAYIEKKVEEIDTKEANKDIIDPKDIN